MSDELQLDRARGARTGVPEIVYAPGKTAEQVRDAMRGLLDAGVSPIIATRCTTAQIRTVTSTWPDAIVDGTTVVLNPVTARQRSVAVVTAGTADQLVAAEAASTLQAFGLSVARVNDVGIAGLHRLLERLDDLRRVDALIVIAGMEGALPTAVAGLVDTPLVAVPTSAGYGSSFEGITALAAMTASCAPGVSVVGIDNGVGAACVVVRWLGSGALGCSVPPRLPVELVDALTSCAPMVVAYSGGVDSAFLAVAASSVLEPGSVRAVTAVSPSLGDDQHQHCAQLAREWGLDWSTVETAEMDDDRYLVNDSDRCFWCKTHLMDALDPIAGASTVVLGVNVDDLGDHRPGQQAARARGARFPLVEAGLTKADIRTLSQSMGLTTWDRPASPCLSSRLPYGTPVTLGRLTAVEQAERGLRRLGFLEVRVRHHGEVGLVEVGSDELDRAHLWRVDIVSAVRAAGFRFVALDLEGFESGRLNRVLDDAGR